MKKSVKKYKVIRYYPDFYIDEFINIGVVMYDNVALQIQMLSTDEIKHLNCSFFTDKKSIENTVTYISSEFSNFQCKEDFFTHSRYLYYDNFSFSEEKSFISEDKLSNELEIIYYRYIGKKLEKENYVAKKERRKNEIVELIAKEFSNKILYKQDDYFDIVFLSKKSGKTYPTIIGSLLNDGDTSYAFKAYINRPYKNTLFGYVNTQDEILNHKEKADHVRSILHDQMGMQLIDVESDEKTMESLEKILEV